MTLDINRKAITGAARNTRISFVARVTVLTVLSLIHAVALALSTEADVRRAPGWGELLYTPPPPGTYQLPEILPAADGEVIVSDGSTTRMFDLMSGRIVFLSFIYTRCSDINGCPLANAVLYKIQSRLNDRTDGAEKQVALLSVSFDPEYDTPEITSAMEKAFRKGHVEWNFLTTRDQDSLQKLLDGYGQYAFREYDEHGHPTKDYAHLLRVYLIDRNLQIRNIYSVSFLHPDLLMNDLDTLLMESSAKD